MTTRVRLIASAVLAAGLIATAAGGASSHEGAAGEVDLTKAVEFRAQYGFDSDAAYVLSVEADPTSSKTYGVALTSGETREMLRREDVAARLAPFHDYLATRPSLFGGLYIDQLNGGRLVVDLVAATEDDEIAIRRVAPANVDIVFASVANTEADLSAAYSLANRLLGELESQGIVIHSVGIDTKRNAIDFGLDTLDRDWIRTISSYFAPGLLVFHDADPIVAATCSTRSNCPSPERLRAGLAISGAGEVCTSGFVVHNGSNSQLLTAGHCFHDAAIGTTVYHAGQSIGQVSDTMRYDYSDADALMIDIPNSRESNWIWTTNTMTTHGWSSVGTTVCRSGITSDVDCGQIVASNETIVVGGFHWVNQGKTNFGSNLGDSGAPIVSYIRHEGFGVMAFETQQNTWYGRLENIEYEFGNYLCVDLGCVNY